MSSGVLQDKQHSTQSSIVVEPPTPATSVLTLPSNLTLRVVPASPAISFLSSHSISPSGLIESQSEILPEVPKYKPPYRSPRLCCCDIKGGLISMAIFDIIFSFICTVWGILGLYAYDVKPDQPTINSNIDRTADKWDSFLITIYNILLLNTKIPRFPNSSYVVLFQINAFMGLVTLLLSIAFLVSTITDSKRACSVIHTFHWITFLASFISTMIYGGVIYQILAALVFLYMIYQAFIVSYFQKEPNDKEFKTNNRRENTLYTDINPNDPTPNYNETNGEPGYAQGYNT